MKVLLERSVRVLPVLLFIAMLAFAACGDDDSEVIPPSPTVASTPALTAPTTPTAAGKRVFWLG